MDVRRGESGLCEVTNLVSGSSTTRTLPQGDGFDCLLSGDVAAACRLAGVRCGV